MSNYDFQMVPRPLYDLSDNNPTYTFCHNICHFVTDMTQQE